MKIDGQEIIFLRSDGKEAEHSVGVGGTGEDGELFFYEIMDDLRPKIKGKDLYRRIIIRRVFPHIKEE